MQIDFEVLRPKFEKIFKFSRAYDDYLSSGKTDDWILNRTGFVGEFFI